MREVVLQFAIFGIVGCCTNSTDCEYNADLGEPVSDTKRFCNLESFVCWDCLGLFTVHILTKFKLARLTLIREFLGPLQSVLSEKKSKKIGEFRRLKLGLSRLRQYERF